MSYRFFSNKACEYFPCHKTDDLDSFNCLFCYCPLYNLNDCGGCFTYTKDNVKDCSHCLIPHTDYDRIVSALKNTARK